MLSSLTRAQSNGANEAATISALKTCPSQWATIGHSSRASQRNDSIWLNVLRRLGSSLALPGGLLKNAIHPPQNSIEDRWQHAFDRRVGTAFDVCQTAGTAVVRSVFRQQQLQCRELLFVALVFSFASLRLCEFSFFRRSGRDGKRSPNRAGRGESRMFFNTLIG